VSDWVLVCESATDAEAVAALIAKVRGEAPAWRRFEGQAFWKVGRRPPAWGSGFSSAIHGRFGGEPGAADAAMWRLLLVWLAQQPPAVVVGVRDTDHDEGRLRGAEQARDAQVWRFELHIAYAVPEIEAWWLALWRWSALYDAGAASELQRRLGFAPWDTPERLTSGREHHPKDTKRALSDVHRGAPEDVVEAWDGRVELLPGALRELLAWVKDVAPPEGSGR
jgi:hypothetical protein